MSSTAAKSCVVAGHICLDVIPNLVSGGDFAQNFQPGRMLETGPAVMATGGAVSNTGQALHKLGINTRLMGKVGQDLFGQAILEIVKSSGEHLAEGMRVVPGEASSYTIILSPPDTDRIFFHCPGANNTFSAADVDYSLLEEVDLFHFGYPPLMERMYQNEGAELAEIFRRAQATGVTTSLDMTLPDPNAPSGQANWPAILQATLPAVDIFAPTITELLYMLYPARFQQFEAGTLEIEPGLLAEIGTDLLGMGVKIALIKAGEAGLYLRTAEQETMAQVGRARPESLASWAKRELWAPIFEAEVAGTTGAGDAAIAGFLAALLRNYPAAEALTLGAAVAACSVEALDALSGVQSWEETLARLEAGWARRPLDFTAPGWQFDAAAQLWRGPHHRS